MRFLVWLTAGIAGGVLGGMGMGGGTVLIPILTIFCGVPQHMAQSVNLLTFLPMSALSLRVHAQNGLLDTKGATLDRVLPPFCPHWAQFSCRGSRRAPCASGSEFSCACSRCTSFTGAGNLFSRKRKNRE